MSSFSLSYTTLFKCFKLMILMHIIISCKIHLQTSLMCKMVVKDKTTNNWNV